ncbi:DUF4396 domain-containing protein [Candidatus Saccharibacteria bacterium]|nr:DUF4396 domain-containing protein [Candidatus Saccharibacteria bacterium]
MITGLNATALRATLHCLLGCSIGEILGMVLGSALGWHGAVTVVASILLAFVFGYALSIIPILAHGLTLSAAMKVAFAADTASIATMEITDNAFMLAVPGAINAGLTTVLFWVSLGLSLVVAFAVAFPVNRWLIARGKGHAVAHKYHGHDHGDGSHHNQESASHDEHTHHH